MSKGIIYVCSTVVEGLIKIGRTTDFDSRMSILEKNGYANVTGLKRYFAIEVDNHEEIEQLLHDIYSKSRVGNTELFSADINQVVQLLSSLSGKQIYPKNETKQEIFENATEAIQSKSIPNGEYIFETNTKNSDKTLNAKIRVENGKFILLKGSMIAPRYNLNSSNKKTIRKNLKIENDILLEDVIFNSPSTAATFVTGNAKNGWLCWKDTYGNAIDKYRKNKF